MGSEKKNTRTGRGRRRRREGKKIEGSSKNKKIPMYKTNLKINGISVISFSLYFIVFIHIKALSLSLACLLATAYTVNLFDSLFPPLSLSLTLCAIVMDTRARDCWIFISINEVQWGEIGKALTLTFCFNDFFSLLSSFQEVIKFFYFDNWSFSS